MDQDNILKHVRTSQEQNELINLIEKLLENTFKDGINTTPAALKSSFMKNTFDVISAELHARSISDNRQETEKFLDSLLSRARSLSVLKITIAFEAKEQLIGSLSSWAEKNIAGNVIFDISVDRQILGGAVIVSKKGGYADFSLLKKINDLFLIKQQEILSLLLPAIPALKRWQAG